MAARGPVSCGLDFSSAPDLNRCLFTATSSKYEFISVSLIHPQFKREFISGPAKNRQGPITRPDTILCSSDWNSLIVGKLSPYINVDSKYPRVKRNSEESLYQELALASHLNVSAITFKLNGNIDEYSNLARIINDKMSTCFYQVWVQVPMENPALRALSYRGVEDVVTGSPWEWWNSFRLICDFHRKLGVALIVGNDLPEPEELERWLGEPVKCLVLPTAIFLSNKKGYPVLSKAHQTIVKKFCALKVQFLITGANRYQNISYYHCYLDYLWKNYRAVSEVERLAEGFEDYLQSPLQPLMDNLESEMYEAFEKDPIKYHKYQVAIQKALTHVGKTDDARNRTIVVMVVGAGRGPLVRAALIAAGVARKQIKVYAVEKNPNAVITLQALNAEMWKDKVTVVSCDTREWNAPEKADILVSELLGSFGDDELSPECLDGAQCYLKDDGVIIPSSYTSYISPVQSSKIYNEVQQCRNNDKGSLAHFETPYVVHLRNKYEIAKPQPLFTFNHPNRDETINNTRYEVRKFSVKQNAVLHGFSGYFDATLFDNVKLSTKPSTYTTGMFSWFPIFFPVKDPIQLKAGDELVVHFWRLCDTQKVWYEWCVSSPVPGTIHNPNGRSYTIGL